MVHASPLENAGTLVSIHSVLGSGFSKNTKIDHFHVKNQLYRFEIEKL